MNEMKDGTVRFIRLTAFSSKAMIKNVHGRSSDLFLLPAAFPETGSSGRWSNAGNGIDETHSSGTVRDLHPIPF